ncbi:unnamed protein product [Tenebrio molitor]|nr:unnamed protein product [Tenebrio molitor]
MLFGRNPAINFTYNPLNTTSPAIIGANHNANKTRQEIPKFPELTLR